MIQDILPYVYRNEFIDKQPSAGSIILCFSGNELLMRLGTAMSDDAASDFGQDDGGIHFPTFMETEGWSNDVKWKYLFAIETPKAGNEEAGRLEFFLASTEFRRELPGYTYMSTEVLRRSQPRHLAFAGITALQLARWYSDTVYCGRCGSPLVASGKERMMHCEKCGYMDYPRISPAVIVAIIDGDNLLLTKYAQGNYHRYALVAGYTEIGETIEETVRREVMEEVGLKLGKLKYYRCQPWSLSGTLLFGFWARVEGSNEIKLDMNELSEAVWMSREDILKEIMPDEISLTREMMLKFAMGQED